MRCFSFLRCLALSAVVALSFARLDAASAKKDGGPQLGIQTWTCRFMKFDEVVDFAVKHKITYLELIKDHMDPYAPKEETLRKKAILDKNGLVAYSFGVNGTSMDKEKNRGLFEFAKLMGMKVIIVEPKNMAEWDNLEQLVKEYDIKLAIHNHSTGTAYGDPATVKKVLASRDHRIGVCLDIGHVTSAGFDAAQIFREYGADRVFDMHLKDKKVEKDASGKNVVLDVEDGTGQANFSGLFAAIKDTKWSGVMAIETDNGGFQKDPNTLVANAKKFFEASKK